MNDSARPARRLPVLRDFLATVWPAISATDTEVQRRKKIAVRSGQVAVMLMIAFGVTGGIAMDWPSLSRLRMAGMVLTGFVYVICFLHGLSGTVKWVLWEQPAGPLITWPPPVGRWQVLYFLIQFGLAALMCLLEGRQGNPALVWLVLLPPVAQSVFLLPRSGIILVSATSMMLLAGAGVWRDWGSVSRAALEFSYAVLFTIVFTALAVTSEKGRAEVERLAGELGDANRKLRAHAAQAQELAVTNERNRLAREIHDSLGHYLTVVNMQIEAARALRQCDPDRMQEALAKAQAMTQQGLQDIRRSVATLRAPPLEEQPLTEILRRTVNENAAAGLAVEMQVLGKIRPLSPQVQWTLYRAGQEGLTNVRKHARTDRAQLVLDFAPAGTVRLIITDQGAGAPASPASAGGFGLPGLRERVQLLGGLVRVQTSPGNGYTLEIEVPG